MQNATHWTMSVIAALGCAGVASSAMAMTVDAGALSRLAKELNTEPIRAADFTSPASDTVSYLPQYTSFAQSSAELIQTATQTLDADLAAGTTSDSRLGSPTPAGFTFGGSPVVTRAGRSEPHHRGPVAISVPLPQSATLALAGLVVVGSVRRRRLGTAENGCV